jgi:2-polyprenyl-3-methyl-5-hydroxy-6-metoxy-1,4-benzoquinol methylase
MSNLFKGMKKSEPVRPAPRTPSPLDAFTKQLVDYSRSPVAPLMSAEELLSYIKSLRLHLADDDSTDVKAQTKTPEVAAMLGEWWQRMALPGTKCFTTSDHSRLVSSNPGFLNTLGDALTPEEAFILRPMPKWAYLKPIFPNVKGKSVLEIGCNNGFFCFEFAELGANQVTGAEVYEGFIKRARWMAAARGTENIEFLLTDALLDLTLPSYDVVFMSEVLGHFVDPFFGILRAINLAKETVIIDNAAMTSLGYEMDLGAGLDPVTGKKTYHAWLISDGLMLNYLLLCGVPPERVKRYISPWQNHIVYVIDTSDVANYRKANDFQPSNTSFINMEWKR